MLTGADVETGLVEGVLAGINKDAVRDLEGLRDELLVRRVAQVEVIASASLDLEGTNGEHFRL